jgi:hypothetical protein
MFSKTLPSLAGLLLAASSASVYARPAMTTFNANLRAGPRVSNPVVEIIPDQAMIDVGRCAGSWCRVSWNGVDGYLSTTLIAPVSSPRSRVIEAEPAEAPSVFYSDRQVVVAPNCDPSFDTACGASYAYDNGFYGDNRYDNYGYADSSFYGGNYGAGYGAGYGGGYRSGYGVPRVGAGVISRGSYYGSRPVLNGGRHYGGAAVVRTSGGGRGVAGKQNVSRIGMDRR